MARSKSSGLLTVGAATLLTAKPGKLHWCSIICAAADVTVQFYDAATAAEAGDDNVLIEFKVDLSLNGFQGGGSLDAPAAYGKGLVYTVTGAGARVTCGTSKG